MALIIILLEISETISLVVILLLGNLHLIPLLNVHLRLVDLLRNRMLMMYHICLG